MRRQVLAAGGRLLLGGIAVALLILIPVSAQEPGPRFSAWSQAVAVGPPLRTPGVWEACPFISKDDLNLFFRKEAYEPSVNGWRFDIYVSHRNSPDDAWGTPVNLGSKINTPASNELCSFLTIDGHWLYFVSNRTDLGAYGSGDIYVSHRKDKDDPAGWETPVNLGPQVNTTANETGPSIFEDEASGKVIMYFTRVVSGRNKIFQTELLDRDNPGPATKVPGLNHPDPNVADWHAFVRRKDGLEVIFASSRDHVATNMSDLYVSTRPTTSAPWSTPVSLGPMVNDAVRQEGRPSLSWDGTELYFWTDREWYSGPGGSWWDIHVYRATRTKITGKK